MLHFERSHPIVTWGSRVSRAPPYHFLPAFLNLNGSSKSEITIAFGMRKLGPITFGQKLPSTFYP